jgi:hypothetical protein
MQLPIQSPSTITPSRDNTELTFNLRSWWNQHIVRTLHEIPLCLWLILEVGVSSLSQYIFQNVGFSQQSIWSVWVDNWSPCLLASRTLIAAVKQTEWIITKGPFGAEALPNDVVTCHPARVADRRCQFLHKQNSVTLVCLRTTIPIERPPLVGEVNVDFCG